jgi:hypothetical protein
MKNRGYIIDQLLKDQGYTCAVCKQPLRAESATFHHTLHDTKGNRKVYPLFINSTCNGKAVCWKCVGKDNQFVTYDVDAKLYEQAFVAIRELIRGAEVSPLKLFSDIECIWRDEA